MRGDNYDVDGEGNSDSTTTGYYEFSHGSDDHDDGAEADDAEELSSIYAEIGDVALEVAGTETADDLTETFEDLLMVCMTHRLTMANDDNVSVSVQ